MTHHKKSQHDYPCPESHTPYCPYSVDEVTGQKEVCFLCKGRGTVSKEIDQWHKNNEKALNESTTNRNKNT